MSQIVILNFLEENKRSWFTSRQICMSCGITRQNGMKSLQKLREYEEVNYKEERFKRNGRFYYRYKKIEDIL